MDPTELTVQAGAFANALWAWAATALPRFVSAILLLAGGWWLADRTRLAVRRLAAAGRVDPTLTTVLSTVTRYAVLIVVGVAVLGQLGIQTTSILAALGAVALAIGLALQGTLQNIAAGIMLLWLRPFRVGDTIETGNVAGTVKDVGLFASELHTGDGLFQFVPNAQLWNVRIINYSRLPTRQIDLSFAVGYDDDLTRGKEVLLGLARDDLRVLREPAPNVFVDRLGEGTVVLRLNCWTANGDFWPTRRHLTERGKQALEAAGLTLPVPQREVHLRTAPDAPPPQVRAA